MSSVEGRMVTCDRCGKQIFQEWVRRASGRRRYNTYHWIEEGDKDYCPSCIKNARAEEYFRRKENA